MTKSYKKSIKIKLDDENDEYTIEQILYRTKKQVSYRRWTI